MIVRFGALLALALPPYGAVALQTPSDAIVVDAKQLAGLSDNFVASLKAAARSAEIYGGHHRRDHCCRRGDPSRNFRHDNLPCRQRDADEWQPGFH